MNNFTTNVGHIVTSLVIIVAVTALAWHGTISGSECLTIIGVLGGVSVGGSVASSSAGAPALSSAVAPASIGTATSDQTNASGTSILGTAIVSAPSTKGVV